MAANHAQRSPGRALKHARFVASDETVSCKAAVAAHAALAGSGLGDLLARSSKRRRLTSAEDSNLRQWLQKESYYLLPSPGRRRHKKNTSSFSEVSCFTDEEDMEREHNDDDREETPEQNIDSDLDLSDREEVKSSDYDSALGWDHTRDVEFEESDDERQVKMHTEPSDSEQSLASFDYHHRGEEEEEVDIPHSAAPAQSDGSDDCGSYDDIYFRQNSD